MYGKPKGQQDYWGIQCKGKDNYLDKKLTKKEIDEELLKARSFEPGLITYIFATTATKDVVIEEYVRVKDRDSVANNGFEIPLYCWEDIADLIEENRDTFNWYVNNFQFREQYGVEILFDASGSDRLKPKFQKSIVKRELRPVPKYSAEINEVLLKITRTDYPKFDIVSLLNKQTNHGWCAIDLLIVNIGNKVIEDWKIWLTFSSSEVSSIYDAFQAHFLDKEALKWRTTWVYKESNRILYKPLNNSSLIQKDHKALKCHCYPSLQFNFHKGSLAAVS